MIPTILTREQEDREDLIEKWLAGQVRTENFVQTVNTQRVLAYHDFKQKERKTVLFKLQDIEA